MNRDLKVSLIGRWSEPMSCVVVHLSVFHDLFCGDDAIESVLEVMCEVCKDWLCRII